MWGRWPGTEAGGGSRGPVTALCSLWAGCALVSVVTPTCSPPCHARAVCRAGNLCECDLHYEGDGRTCSGTGQGGGGQDSR